MATLEIRIIVPVMKDPSGQERVLLELVGKEIVVDEKSLLTAVKTWNHKPKFQKELELHRDGAVTGRLWTNDQPYTYVMLGTRYRRAVMSQFRRRMFSRSYTGPRGSKKLVDHPGDFSGPRGKRPISRRNWLSKSRVGKLRAYKGAGHVVVRGMRSPVMPGIVAREHHALLAKHRTPIFHRNIGNAYKRIAKGAFKKQKRV